MKPIVDQRHPTLANNVAFDIAQNPEFGLVKTLKSCFRRPEWHGVAWVAGGAGYFRMRCGVGVGCGAAGDITNVSHTFQPSGRCSAANSL